MDSTWNIIATCATLAIILYGLYGVILLMKDWITEHREQRSEKRRIENLPNAVPVIRCRDCCYHCVYKETDFCERYSQQYDDIPWLKVSSDGYCDWGIEKESLKKYEREKKREEGDHNAEIHKES